MRKKTIYNAVNKQEDEDGYNINPANTNFYGNAKRKKRISSYNNNTGNTAPGSMHKQNHSIILSHPMMPN